MTSDVTITKYKQIFFDDDVDFGKQHDYPKTQTNSCNDGDNDNGEGYDEDNVDYDKQYKNPKIQSRNSQQKLHAFSKSVC